VFDQSVFRLPKRRISRTWIVEREFPEVEAKQLGSNTKPRATREAMAERRERFRAMMAAEGLSRAGLARKLGVSRAWVTKVLGRHNPIQT